MRFGHESVQLEQDAVGVAVLRLPQQKALWYSACR